MLVISVRLSETIVPCLPRFAIFSVSSRVSRRPDSDVGRGTGILNNESYFRCMVWNKHDCRKIRKQSAEQPASIMSTLSRSQRVPEMRIVPDKLGHHVRNRQKEIGKTPGHEPASLQVHGSIANIMASMEVLDIMQQQFLAAAQNDLMARMASGEIDTVHKRKQLLDGYAEELILRFPEWANLQVSVVAGAGFEPAAFRL
jgi:hypothetical protein